MTEEQEKHLLSIQKAFYHAVDKKYRAGAKEHGGNLTDATPLQLIEWAMDECVDQWTYLKTCRDKLIK